MSSVSFTAITGLPEITSGADLGSLIWHNLPSPLQRGDIIVVTHKMVSKSENNVVSLSSVRPSPLAARFAARYDKDPRLVELVLRESRNIMRMTRGLIISRTHHGFVCANAGIDISNSQGDTAILLPKDPDLSARRLSQSLEEACGFVVPVIVCDSFGRAWRNGIVNVAIGVANLCPFSDYRGQKDPNGLVLKASVMASADAIAAGAELVMGKLARVPAALVRGFTWNDASEASSTLDGQKSHGSGQDLIMSERKNLFP